MERKNEDVRRGKWQGGRRRHGCCEVRECASIFVYKSSAQGSKRVTGLILCFVFSKSLIYWPAYINPRGVSLRAKNNVKQLTGGLSNSSCV